MVIGNNNRNAQERACSTPAWEEIPLSTVTINARHGHEPDRLLPDLSRNRLQTVWNQVVDIAATKRAHRQHLRAVLVAPSASKSPTTIIRVLREKRCKGSQRPFRRRSVAAGQHAFNTAFQFLRATHTPAAYKRRSKGGNSAGKSAVSSTLGDEVVSVVSRELFTAGHFWCSSRNSFMSFGGW